MQEKNTIFCKHFFAITKIRLLSRVRVTQIPYIFAVFCDFFCRKLFLQKYGNMFKYMLYYVYGIEPDRKTD